MEAFSGEATWLLKRGRGFRFQKYRSGLEINGAEYDFTNGKGFFVSDKMNRLMITQLNIPLMDAKADVEIKRLVKLKRLQKPIIYGWKSRLLAVDRKCWF